MKDKKIILIDTGSESNHFMMSDVSKMKNAIQISEPYKIKSTIMKLFFKLHFGFKLNKYFDFPFKSIWNKQCILEDILKKNDDEYYLILVNDVIRKFSDSYLHKLENMNNVHVYLLLLDAYDKIQPYFRRSVNKVRSEFIYSFQKSDCEKYGFQFTNTIYSMIDISNMTDGKKSDIYFIGAEKGRVKVIYEIYKKLTKIGLQCNFIVITSLKSINNRKNKYPGLDFRTQRIDYKEVLQGIYSTKCILELCLEGQDGLTMRFYEAIFYNKFLITNNITAYSHELFNPQYMITFNTVEDIDTQFLHLDTVVNYQYKYEMSPTHFVEHIINRSKSNRGFLV